ncbi:hypothetical protein AAC387_Pa09g1112 [Persea americana]
MLLHYDARYRSPPLEKNIQYPPPFTPPPSPPPSLADYDFYFPPPPPPPPPPPEEYELHDPLPLPPLDDYPRYLGVGKRYRRGPCYLCRMDMAVWFIGPCRHLICCGICVRRYYRRWLRCPLYVSPGERAGHVPTFR